MSQRFDLNGKVAVITGAGSGIGRGLAHALAKRGCHLALADINEAGLQETFDQIGEAVSVSRHVLDVADPKAVAALPDKVLADHGQVDVLVNNAGVALGGNFDQVSAEDFDWVMNINFNGVVRTTRAFLPHLKAQPQAQLVNISSLFGLIAPPGHAAYCASKFAVRGFSNALRHELEAEGSGLRVTVVHPGGVATQIATSARIAKAASNEIAARMGRFSELLKMPPAEAGEIIAQAIETRSPRVLVGKDAKSAALIERLFPVSYWKKIAGGLS